MPDDEVLGDSDAAVFKGLADPTRRLLLDRLLARGGQTLGELEADLAMTRFGVMKHLRVLEEAGLVVSRKQGRARRHYLNPVPIRLIHDRWIGKYTELRAAALADLKTALEGPVTSPATSSATGTATATQVFRVHIKATPEQLWTAITSPEWTARYGYRTPSEYDLRPGGTFRSLANEGMKAFGAPDVVVEGEVVEADPPRRLVQTWRMLFEPAQAAEPYTRVTWEIDELPGGLCRLTVVHDVTDAPAHAALISGEILGGGGGGWPYILSDLKSLLETGTAHMSEAAVQAMQEAGQPE